MTDPLDAYETRRQNQAAWQRMAQSGNRFATPATDADLANPLASVDGPNWLGGDIRGWRVLCLAAGGGRQGPIYAAAGAIVTVVDFSTEMLRLDLQVSQDRKLRLRTVETSMDDLTMFETEEFDLVVHPVSTCYIADISSVYRQVARVLRPGGLYISQHKQPTSLQASITTHSGHYKLLVKYYRDTPLPPERTAQLVREPGTHEYIHRWEQLIGAMCRSGFVIEDFTEPLHADGSAAPDTFEHRSQYIAPYVRIKARRTQTQSPSPQSLIVAD